MPSLRERDVTDALINLSAPPSSNNCIDEGAGSDDLLQDIAIAHSLCPFGHDVDVTFDAVDIYVAIDVPDGEDLSGSTSTPSRLSSDDSGQSQAHFSNNSSCEKVRSAKRNAKSGIWQFFEIYKDPKLQSWHSVYFVKQTLTTALL
jgi:hypothetical protein